MPPTEEKKETTSQTTTTTEQVDKGNTQQTQAPVKQTLAQEKQEGQDAFDEAFVKPKVEKSAKGEGKGQKGLKQTQSKDEPKKENKDATKTENTEGNADDSKDKSKQEESKEKTAQERLEERANQLGGGDTKEKKEVPSEKKVDPPAKTAQEPPKDTPKSVLDLTPESMQKFRETITASTVKIGNSDVNMKQFAEDYPDEFNVIMAVGTQAGKQMAEQAVAKIMEGMVKASDIQDLRDEMAHRSFMEEVMRSHADVHDVIKSDGFKAFMEKQPKGVQNMANSNDPADAKFILDAYKESIGKSNSIKKAQEAKEAKERKDSLLDDTETTGSSRTKTTTQDNKNDFNAGFDEAED